MRFRRLSSRFARLRVPLLLGKDAIDLPEPLAALVQGLPIAVASGTARRLPDPGGWLFPGRRPGRAAHSATLATRLRRLGLEPPLATAPCYTSPSTYADDQLAEP